MKLMKWHERPENAGQMLTHASLFSGIGGAEIAAAWPGSAGERMMTATSGRRLFVPSMRSGPLGSWVRMCLGSRRWYSPARRLTWAAQTIFSRREIYTERSGDSSSTASAGTSRTRDIPSSRLLYRLVPSERRTGGTGFGLLRGGKMSDMMLKTPTAMDAEIGSPKREPKSGDSGCLAQEIMGGYAVILPTPTAMDSTEATARMKSSQTKDGSMHSVTLARAVHTLLPTPCVMSVRHSKRVSAAKAQGSVSFRSRLNGEETPTGLEDWLEFHGLLHPPIADEQRSERMRAEDFEEMLPENAKSQGFKDGRASQLNPLFVGEMMGYPLEWLTSPFLSGDGDVRP